MKRVLPFLLLILGLFTGISESWSQVPGLPNRWNSVSMPNLDTGLVMPATFTVGGKTYLVGGDTSEYFGAHKRWTKQVWVYTHATNTWSKTTPFPGEKRLGAVAFGSTSTGKGYYGLGYDTVGFMDTAWRTLITVNGNQVYRDTLVYFHVRYMKDWWEFDTATLAWTQKKNFPIQDIPAVDGVTTAPLVSNGMANATGFSLDTVVKWGAGTKNFAGGIMSGEYQDISWDTTKGLPTPPGYGQPTWDGYIYQAYNKKPYFYDAAQDSFYAGPDCPGVGRSNATALILDGSQSTPGRNPKLYTGLGDNDAYNLNLLNIYLKDWWSFDFNTASWNQERNLPDTGKSNPGAFAYEHLGMVVCGYDGEWKKNFFIYNTEDEDWVRYPDYRDSGRSLGAAFIHGNRGFYGAGFRGNSEELETFSWYNIDTNTIRLYPLFSKGDTFCAGATIVFDWYSEIAFNPGAKMIAQISDETGEFEWPITANSNMDTFDITGKGGTITSEIPLRVKRGGEYKIRILSTSPFYISRTTPTFFVKENPKFTYSPKIHPFIDTVCLNADFFIPTVVSGDKDIKGYFDYTWIKDGVATGDTLDTLFITQMQFAQAGEYRLIAQGDCYPDTSASYYIAVENIPPPVILDNLDYPGMIGDSLYICEYDTNTWYISATGKKLSYQWYHNGTPLDSRDNIEGLGGPVIKNLTWNLEDSGVYKVRAIEACGAYTESDSIVVGMRAVPRVVTEPKNITPAVLEGVTVGFRVYATGYNLQYQWRKESSFMSDDGRITGTQTDTMTIRNLIPGDVAFYSCIVTGGCPGFADTSNLAIIDLNASPTIIKEPNDTLEICEGQSNIVTIVAAGTNLRYRWQLNQAPPNGLNPAYFFGTDTRELIVDGAPPGTYEVRCEVDNQAGANVFSKVCLIIVKPTPAKPVVTQIGNLMQCDLNCETYLWFFNGVWKGQFNSKLIKPDEEGDFTVRVICDGCPSEISEPEFFISSVVRANLETLEMYPNPATDRVVLELPGITAENPAAIHIYDLSGKLVQTIYDVTSENYEVELSKMSKGMYIVHVSSAAKSFSGKLIKE